MSRTAGVHSPLAERRRSTSCQLSVRRTIMPRTGMPSKMNFCSSLMVGSGGSGRV
jgi:hypothetical protein